MVKSTTEQIEALVTNWAEDRACLLSSNSATWPQRGREVHAHDAELVRALPALLPAEGHSRILNQALRAAKHAFSTAIEHSYNQQAIAGSSKRVAIQREIDALWQQVGFWRGRPHKDVQIDELHAQYRSRTFGYRETLTTQLCSVSAEAPARIRGRVDRTLRRLCKHAAERGEDRYFAAVRTAQALYASLPGKASQLDQMYRTLRELSSVERADVLEVFHEDYGEPFEVMVHNAYESLLVRLKCFLRMPALKSALEDEYGIGVGLWNTEELHLRSLNWKTRLARLKQSSQVLITAFRQLRPRSFRGWQEYRRELLTFVHRLGEIANGPELARIRATLQNHHVDVAVHSLFLSTWRGDACVGEQEKHLLQRLSSEQLLEVEKRFAANYRQYFGNDHLRATISKVWAGHEAELLHALLDGNMHGADAVQFHLMINGTRAQRLELLQWLAQLPPRRIQGLTESYEDKWNAVVDRKFLRHWFKGPLLDWAYYLVCNDPQMAAAARLECALRCVSGEWPGAVFYDQPEHRDLAVIEAHEQRYKTSVWRHLQRMGGVERAQIMRTLVTKGAISTAEQIRHCLIGIGADTEAIKATLSELNGKQNASLARQYASHFSRIELRPSVVLRALHKAISHIWSQRTMRGAGETFTRHLLTPRNLDGDLNANLCGYNRFDVRLLREGRTSNPAVLFDRLMQRVAFEQAGAPYCNRRERSGKWPARLLAHFSASRIPLVAKIVSRLQRRSPIESLKNRDVDAAVEYYESNLRGQSADEQVRRRFVTMVRIANQRLDAFREMQHRKAERHANIGALLTSTGAFIGLVAMNLPYVPLACSVGAASMAGRYLVKTRIKGDGYGEREASRDAFMAVVDGPTLALGQFVKTLRLLQALGLGRTVLGSAVKMTLTQTVQRWGRSKITDALLKSKESIHARRHLVSRGDAVLEEYRQMLQQERERVLTGRLRNLRKVRSIERVFRSIGKQIAARNGEKKPGQSGTLNSGEDVDE